jgi:hypothetical protein
VLLRPSQFHKKIYSFTLVALILWLSGVGCSLCCVKGSVKAYYEVETVSQIQSTPSVDQAETSQESCQKEEADCCKKRIIKTTEKANSQFADLKRSETEGDTLLQISQQDGVVACSLLPKHIPSLIVAPPSANNPAAVAEPIHSTFAAVALSSELAFTHPVLPQNRSGGTYLHCCVFLI